MEIKLKNGETIRYRETDIDGHRFENGFLVVNKWLGGKDMYAIDSILWIKIAD